MHRSIYASRNSMDSDSHLANNPNIQPDYAEPFPDPRYWSQHQLQQQLKQELQHQQLQQELQHQQLQQELQHRRSSEDQRSSGQSEYQQPFPFQQSFPYPLHHPNEEPKPFLPDEKTDSRSGSGTLASSRTLRRSTATTYQTRASTFSVASTANLDSNVRRPSSPSTSTTKKKLRNFQSLRFSFLLVNIVFVLIGILVIVAGSWLHFSKSKFHQVVPHRGTSEFYCTASLTIAIGLLFVVVAAFGLFGSSLQCRGALLSYFVLVLILILLQSGLGLTGFALQNEIDALITGELEKGIQKVRKFHSNQHEDADAENFVTELDQAWDSIQRDWRCCGILSYEDWVNDPDNRQSAVKPQQRRRAKSPPEKREKKKKSGPAFFPSSCCNVFPLSSNASEIDASRVLHPIHLPTIFKTCLRKTNTSNASNSSFVNSPISIKSSPTYNFFSTPPPPTGCYAGLKRWLTNHELYFLIGLLVLAVFQFFGLISALLLFCMLGDYKCC